MRRPFLLTSLLLAMGVGSPALHAQATEPPAESSAEQSKSEPGQQPEAEVSQTRAQRQEEALRRQFPAAQLRQLEAGDDAFLGLFLAAAQPRPRGGVLLIADRDEHPDWPQLIGPARRQLSDQGWHTLAISLPDMPTTDPALGDAAQSEVLAEIAERTSQRINMAAQALAAEGASTLIVLGRGEGAYWALHATGAQARPPVEATALILHQTRAPARAAQGDPQTLELLAEWSKPAYEVFTGAEDATRERARQRELNARRHGRNLYSQLLLREDTQSALGQRVLVKRLQGWLENHIPVQQP